MEEAGFQTHHDSTTDQLSHEAPREARRQAQDILRIPQAEDLTASLVQFGYKTSRLGT